ncbi:KGGVGR-motif variant AAA ATPase [Geomonas oryzae]|uniref:KGGVGR-motif variant AAA ATPase n=1 Tax=Geomonas oryzae TaxID=2364273 RepID=UPI0038B29A47
MRLLTWLDIRRLLKQAFPLGRYPAPIITIDCYWDVIEVYVSSIDDIANADAILHECFRSWYKSVTDGEAGVYLETKYSRYIPIAFVEDSEHVEPEREIRPFWDEFVYRPRLEDTSAEFFPSVWVDGPSMILFQSFKGGVGRTTHLAAYLQVKMASESVSKVLVVDADVEAPGLTVWDDHEISGAGISFIDFMELVHNDLSEGAESSLDFITKELQKTGREKGNCTWYFMPAYRTQEQILDWPIRPEHIVKGEYGPWALSDLLQKLGKKLGVDVVLIDLRAGASELSSPLMFDSRIKRVIVTTMNEQSLKGTELIIKQIAKLAPNRNQVEHGRSSDPNVIISMVQSDKIENTEMEMVHERLLNCYPDYNDSDDDSTPSRLAIYTSEFAQELLLVNNWDDLSRRLEGTDLYKTVKALAEKIEVKGPAVAESEVEYNAVMGSAKTLGEFCEMFEYAESGKGTDILITSGLRKLGQSYRDRMPNLVVIGSKGAGKTFTYIQLARLQQWSHFIRKALPGEGQGDSDALFFPLLEPVASMQEAAIDVTNNARTKAWKAIHGKDIPRWSVRDIISNIKDATVKCASWSETDWEKFWLNEVVAALGFGGAESSITPEYLDNLVKLSGVRIIFLIDGLETTLQEIDESPIQQKALRALLELPSAFSMIRDSAIGFIILVRKDLAATAIKQNFGQFADKYKEFALNWDFRESLQLVAWLCINASVLESLNIDSMVKLNTRDLEQKLYPIWGAKLGSPTANEARSSIWVYAALSDFNGRLQARDLVRLLIYAASKSHSRTDRLLTPTAIRQALQPCSAKKVDEAQQEFPELKEINVKFQQADESARHIPFTRDELGITADEVERLERIGIVLNLDNKLYMPEIYRFGFNFKLEGGARPKVLALKKKFLTSIENELR